MADFIISPYAISFDSIRNGLQNYVLAKPENETWKDFYASGAGQTIIEIAAALGAFYAYQFILGRRESFLSVAENYSSILGLAQNLGYSASRGKNVQINVDIIPNQTITLPKWSIIGAYTEYDLVLMEDVILNEGVQTTVPVIIGNSLVESKNITTSALTQFTFANPSVTDTCRLILNSNEVPNSTNIREALNDKYIMISNVLGSVDVFYLQIGNHRYDAGDTLHLQFIERNNLSFGALSMSNIAIDYASQVNEFTLIEDISGKEDVDSIKLKAPLYHETSMVIRSRKDYSKYLLLANPLIIAANDKDIYPGLIAITYIKNDGMNLTNDEKEFWLNQIEEARPSGVARAEIVDSIQVNETLNISLWRKSNESISGTVSQEINKILSKYEQKFNVALDLNDIEHEIEQLPGVKIARVELTKGSWTKSKLYNLYDMITKNGNTYYVGDFIYRTGGTEPTWPTTKGATVVDNKVIWKKVDEYEGLVLDVWEPNKEVSRYDYIKVQKNGTVSIFVCDNYVNRSGSTAPTWGATIVYDNEIVWQKLNSGTSSASWEASTIYSIGNTINTGSGTYKVSSYRGKSGSTEPTWVNIENGQITDNQVKWFILDEGSTGMLFGWNEYLKLDKKITIVG